jgi:hypothetical protein
MNKNEIAPELNNETIESMIYDIRGVKVMLDFDLAKIYGYSTKAFNQQVQRNIEKFPDDFMFKLTSEEWNYILRSQNVTANNMSKTRVDPYAFTEQGIYMVMTVLKGELAIRQSIALVKAFKQMKDYIIESNNILSLNEILKMTYKNTKDINDINKKLKVVMESFIDSSSYKHFVFFEGERLEADVAFQKIFVLAKHTIYIIDNYIDIKTLQLLKICKPNIKVTIFTDNKNKAINESILNDYRKDTNTVLTIKENKTFHDRYIIIDYKFKSEKLFHLGSSIKDTGKSGSEIKLNEDIEIYRNRIEELLNK